MPKNPIEKLENSNIRSLDPYAGEQVNSYLYGDITRSELASLLKSRKKEMLQAIKGIDKLLDIVVKCPPKAPPTDES